MQVQQLPISKFLKTANSLIVPVYQRDYAWKRLNCDKLWSDIQQLISNKRSSHFLGTIVTINDGYGKYLVIDGQQRLTTITIFLLALSHYLRDKENPTEEEVQLQKVFKGYLIDEESISQETRIKLKPNKSDLEYFEKLFDEKKEIIENNSNIVNNYLFFKEEFEKNEISARKIFEDGLQKLHIVSIDLSRGQDDPQLIFESLNSTGVDLTAGDLIRNYILMDLEPQEQEKKYKKYWVEIERLTSDVAEFIRNYLIFKTRSWVKKDDVYLFFKKFAIDTYDNNKELILEDLLKYATIYGSFIQTQKHKNEKISSCLARISRIEFTVCYPYLFDIFTDLENGDLNEDNIIDILNTIESYSFRKILVDGTTQGLNKLFITLAKEIKKELSSKEDYLNILSYVLLEKRVSQRFPTDEEFENALINKEIYRFQSKNRNFLLESLENYKTAIPINLEDLSVEHIMPQTLTKDWKNKLGENWQEVHGKYLHTLGNLSLTAKNSELSNNSFEDKQKIDFQTSKLKLNFNLDNSLIWNEEQIVSRARNLSKDAKEIWKYPKTTFKKDVPEEQIFDLTNEDSFSGSKPSILYFEDDNKGIEIKTWRDLLSNVCKFLYEYSPTEFKEIQNKTEFQWNFNVDKPLRNPVEFLNGKFVEGNMSANNIISFLKILSESLNYNPENIQFSIKNTK
jgi:uncharacterized protein with ParB-like and HNH nuclease domain